MRTVLLASLRHHTRRYVAAGLAVVDRRRLRRGHRDAHRRHPRGPDRRRRRTRRGRRPRRHRERLRRTARSSSRRPPSSGVPALALGYAMEPVTRDGVQLSPSADVSEVSLDPALQWQTLEDGRFPTRPGEALADANAAKSTGVEVGDVLRVGNGDAATDVEVVGLADSPAAATTSLYVPWETLQRFRGTLWVDAVAWGGPTDLAAQVAPGRHDRDLRRLGRGPAGRDLPRCRRPRGHGADVRLHRALRRGDGHRQHLLHPLRPADARLRPAALRRRHPTTAAPGRPPRGARPRRRGIGRRRSSRARRWATA